MSHVSSKDVPPSLLSLSIAAASTPPMQLSDHTTKHRRLSSLGRSRRRLSDARDAATRPVPSSLQTTAASLAALSLTSPTPSHPSLNTQSTRDLSPSPRKRAVFSCECCSKVYRHPSCLIKHRWEHTPQWREASKFVLSKHQQVQLLEAAAILSHLSPSSASLPEDRSLWPSFLSGGLVPPPANKPPHAISSSVPTGPSADSRLHVARSVTQALSGVPTTEDDALNLLALGEAPHVRTRGHSVSHAYSHSLSSMSHAKERERRRSNAFEYAYTTPTGWSLPRSSIRSQSGSRSRSESHSASESRSDGEYGDDVGFDDVDDDPVERKPVDHWDGMEMEMEMD